MSSLRNSLLVLALAVACKTYQPGDSSLPSVDQEGGAYPNPPPRQVVTEAGPIGTPGKSDGGPRSGVGGFGLGGGAGGASGGGGGRTDGSYPDAPVPGTGGSSGGNCTACSLLAQDCPSRSLGCYPSNGGSCCQTTGGLPEGSQCSEDSQCDRGMVCVDLLCTSLCDTGNPPPRCRACTPFGTTQGVGTCDR